LSVKLEMLITFFFIFFAGLAIGCAVAMVAQRNPLYSAISLIGVFLSLSSLYLMLSAPFIAAVQVIVYAGAIMVLVVFVIMLLNVTAERRRRQRSLVRVPFPFSVCGRDLSRSDAKNASENGVTYVDANLRNSLERASADSP